MLGRVERAVLSVTTVARVHIGRWDEVLPPTPQDVWDANLATVVRALG